MIINEITIIISLIAFLAVVGLIEGFYMPVSYTHLTLPTTPYV